MRIPIPTDRLVALTLLGTVLTAAVAVSLAAPGALPGPSDDDPAALPSDAPTPNPDFTPAVQRRPPGDDEGAEHEEDGYDGDEDDEHDDEDGRDGDDH